MATERQIRANRENGKKSTGPQTKSGKSVSRRNALKHGLSAKKFLLEGETPEEFEALRDALYREHDPRTASECELVEIIASHFWRLRRVPEFEVRLLNQSQNSDQAIPRLKGIAIYPWVNVPGGPDPDRGDSTPVQRQEADSYEKTEQSEPRLIRFAQHPEPGEVPTYSRLEQIDRHQTSLLNGLIKALHLLSVLQSRR